MENSKFFTSTNDKKGILLEAEEGNLSVSIWKKETPVSVILDQGSAEELRNFITLNFPSAFDSEEEERKISFWADIIKEGKKSPKTDENEGS